jgi:hypothetical protein
MKTEYHDAGALKSATRRATLPSGAKDQSQEVSEARFESGRRFEVVNKCGTRMSYSGNKYRAASISSEGNRFER